ncbi:MAG: hypothetical protein Q7K55_02740 [Candidatus Levybacteria bacterium]|nr:hypothetical protein [Candidatus Levybacteria bacterium]
MSELFKSASRRSFARQFGERPRELSRDYKKLGEIYVPIEYDRVGGYAKFESKYGFSRIDGPQTMLWSIYC